MPKLGLQSRLLILTLLVLTFSLGLTGAVLDASFRASNTASAEQQLELVIYSVMGAVEEAEDGLFLPDDATLGVLSQPESGRYALVQTTDGDALWMSRSARLSDVEFTSLPGSPGSGDSGPVRLAPGDFRFVDGRDQGLDTFFLSYAVIWEDRGEEVELLFRAAADSGPFELQVNEFRRSLLVGMLAVALLMVLVQIVAVRVGLRPVRVMADEVADLEAGKRQSLSGDYPHELTGLAGNLDRFIEHETASRARHRNALDDLAHSLKTPLAVIRNALRDAASLDRSLLNDQLDRMETTVAHQLSRAVSSGPVVVGHLVPIRGVCERLSKALRTAYRDKDLRVDITGSQELKFRGDERDLMEMLGNLLENAFKYTNQRVQVRVVEPDADRATGLAKAVLIVLDDDGPGIAADQQAQVLSRGGRGDTATQGQGIGLSVVVELVSLYGGELTLGESPLGGARVEVLLPG